ncbi:hypothetical protein ADUPG1_010980, partial [Aduncisulcus paluster]
EGGIPEPPHCFVCVLSTTDRDEMARLIGSSNKSAKSSSDFIESSFVEEKQPKPKPSKTMSDKRGKLKKKRKNNGIAGACTCAGKITVCTPELAPFFSTGSIGNFAENLSFNLSRLGHNVSIVTPMYGPFYSLFAHNHEFVPLPLPGVFESMKIGYYEVALPVYGSCYSAPSISPESRLFKASSSILSWKSVVFPECLSVEKELRKYTESKDSRSTKTCKRSQHLPVKTETLSKPNSTVSVPLVHSVDECMNKDSSVQDIERTGDDEEQEELSISNEDDEKMSFHHRQEDSDSLDTIAHHSFPSSSILGFIKIYFISCPLFSSVGHPYARGIPEVERDCHVLHVDEFLIDVNDPSFLKPRKKIPKCDKMPDARVFTQHQPDQMSVALYNLACAHILNRTIDSDVCHCVGEDGGFIPLIYKTLRYGLEVHSTGADQDTSTFTLKKGEELKQLHQIGAFGGQSSLSICTRGSEIPPDFIFHPSDSKGSISEQSIPSYHTTLPPYGTGSVTQNPDPIPKFIFTPFHLSFSYLLFPPSFLDLVSLPHSLFTLPVEQSICEFYGCVSVFKCGCVCSDRVLVGGTGFVRSLIREGGGDVKIKITRKN